MHRSITNCPGMFEMLSTSLVIEFHSHFSLITWFYCRDVHGYILRLPCYSFGNFSIVRENFELYGRVVKTFEGLLVQECMFECIRHPHCRSITTTDSAGVKCKLHDKSAEDPDDNRIMSPSSGWTYRTTDPREENVSN